MKHFFLLLAAALSVVAAASAATRPHFGGTLRVEMRGTLTSFDVAPEPNADDALLRDTVLSSVCDRLVALDSNGDPRPSLATAWRNERDARSWYLTVRAGIVLHNGSTLTQQMIITALTAANPNWRVRSEGREVLVQSDTQLVDLLYQLAEPRNSICLAGDNEQWIGSGPFKIAEFQSGKVIELRAFDDAWQGRPFLDRIHIEIDKSLLDQAADLQLGRADLIEGGATTATQPLELIALVFLPNHPGSSGPQLREAIAGAIDRNSVVSVLLRRQGEASASLLPEWISGYAHLFNTAQHLTISRQGRVAAGSLVPLSLAYDGSDPLAKLIAERVAVNAREAGIALQPISQAGDARSSTADVTLVRLRLASPDPATAVAGIGAALNLPQLQKAQSASSAEVLYGIESDALKDYSIIPIAHIPESFTVVPSVHDWTMTRWGEISFGTLWIEASK